MERHVDITLNKAIKLDEGFACKPIFKTCPCVKPPVITDVIQGTAHRFQQCRKLTLVKTAEAALKTISYWKHIQFDTLHAICDFFG